MYKWSKLNKAQLGNTIRFDVNEWMKIFLMCIFPGLSCQWELTSQVSLVSHSKVCWRDKPPYPPPPPPPSTFAFVCLFVWSPPSLSVPIKQNTWGKTQNSNHFDQHQHPRTSRAVTGLYTLKKMPARFIVLCLLARVGCVHALHRPVCVWRQFERAVCVPSMVCVHGDVGLSVNHRVDMEDFSHGSFSTVDSVPPQHTYTIIHTKMLL